MNIAPGTKLSNRMFAGFQTGAITIFTGIFVLVLMTLLLVYASRTGIFEQRISANEMRQKQAFHAAESGVSTAMEFLFANSIMVASDKEDILPDGTDGWLAAGTGNVRWVECSAAGTVSNLRTANNHPCAGEVSDGRLTNSFFYAIPGNDSTTDRAAAKLNIDSSDFLGNADTAFSVWALLCVLDPDFTATPPVTNCSKSADVVGEGDNYMITLLASGYSDCTDSDNSGAIEALNAASINEIDSCLGEARVAMPVSNYNIPSGSPTVPLTTKTTFPPTGTAEIVPNPNAGGEGVPVSVWANSNTSCPGGTPAVTGDGSWATCELHEWYGVDAQPGDAKCNQPTCSCTQAEAISYTVASQLQIGLDIQDDSGFPCDLFEFYFGVPRSQYQSIKASAQQILADCSTLGPNSFGVIWISGPTCQIAANTTVGSLDAPVVLVSAATLTRFNGGATIYGTVYIADVEDPLASFSATGTNTVIGAVIVDALLGQFQGTFQIVYNEGALSDASGSDGLGVVPGGWRDFDIPDME
jgi:hypothetical protein